MTLLIQQARLSAPGHHLHGKKISVLIDNGVIAQISESPLPATGEVIASEHLWLSAGWADMQAFAGEPGLEYKEDLRSLAATAAAGGFTDVAVLPNTKPVVQTKESVEFVRNRSAHLPVRLHPYAALSKEAEGQEMTELLDLHHAGAIAFTDGLHPLNKSSLTMRCLQYLAQFGGLLINQPEDREISAYGQMHEGEISTLLGMKGVPSLAEEMAIRRDLALLEYAGGRLHFAAISAARSVELIREAKQRGLNVTCGVTVGHLYFADHDLVGFDSHLKASPPFRSVADRTALWEGLLDGTIDVVVSDHHPQDVESKNLEFDLADVGMISLQTFFPTLCAAKPDDFPLDRLIEKITTEPRKLLGLPQPILAEGQPACLTAFDPTLVWLFSAQNNRSKSVNSPFLGKNLSGAVLATINGPQVARP